MKFEAHGEVVDCHEVFRMMRVFEKLEKIKILTLNFELDSSSLPESFTKPMYGSMSFFVFNIF